MMLLHDPDSDIDPDPDLFVITHLYPQVLCPDTADLRFEDYWTERAAKSSANVSKSGIFKQSGTPSLLRSSKE
jgi:hypothetical protein